MILHYYALYLHRCDPLSAYFAYGSDTVITHNLSISASELNINTHIHFHLLLSSRRWEDLLLLTFSTFMKKSLTLPSLCPQVDETSLTFSRNVIDMFFSRVTLVKPDETVKFKMWFDFILYCETCLLKKNSNWLTNYILLYT